MKLNNGEKIDNPVLLSREETALIEDSAAARGETTEAQNRTMDELYG